MKVTFLPDTARHLTHTAKASCGGWYPYSDQFPATVTLLSGTPSIKCSKQSLRSSF